MACSGGWSAFLPLRKASNGADLTANRPRPSAGTRVGLRNLLGFGISRGQLPRRGEHRGQSPGKSDQPLVRTPSRASPCRGGLLPASGQSPWRLRVVRQNEWQADQEKGRRRRYSCIGQRADKDTHWTTLGFLPRRAWWERGGQGDCSLIYVTVPFCCCCCCFVKGKCEI